MVLKKKMFSKTHPNSAFLGMIFLTNEIVVFYKSSEKKAKRANMN